MAEEWWKNINGWTSTEMNEVRLARPKHKPDSEFLRETTGHRWYRLVWCNAVITVVQSRAGLKAQDVK